MPRDRLLILFRLLGLACLVLLAPACGPPPPAPTSPDPADQARIVALSPAVAVMLRDLGLGDRIVGRHDYDMVLPRSIRPVGHQEAIDYEALLACDPTHVVIEWGSRPLPPRLSELAAAERWELVTVRLLTLDDIARTVDDLAIRFGVVDFSGLADRRPPDLPTPGPGPIVPRFEHPARRLEVELPSARLARAWSRRGEGYGAIGGVLLLASTDPAGALGPGSFHHEILERIGGTPAIASGAPWMELDAEDVLRLEPGAIVLIAPRTGEATTDPPGADELRRRLGRLATLDIPAVRTGRIALIDHPLALTPSTAMAAFADELARVLEVWAGKP
jgi:ABC-type hemin transport system substrate-binding protein